MSVIICECMYIPYLLLLYTSSAHASSFFNDSSLEFYVTFVWKLKRNFAPENVKMQFLISGGVFN